MSDYIFCIIRIVLKKSGQIHIKLLTMVILENRMDMTGDFLLYNMHEYYQFRTYNIHEIYQLQAHLKNNVHSILNCKKKNSTSEGQKMLPSQKTIKNWGKILQCI